MRRSRLLYGIAAVATAILIVPGSAYAKGGAGGGGGGETVANSLSVPALYVGASNPSGLTCDGTYKVPTGDPRTGFPVEGYFYVQGTHSWQAGCLQNVPTASAAAAWGDNLTGTAKLKVGSPIRVEMGLDAGSQGLTGFDVIKLEPAQLDRLSAYGTKALVTVDPVTQATTFASNPVVSTETRVWDVGAHLKIYNEATPAAPIFDGPAAAEINATGRVVYGYNLRVTAAGRYVIEYTFPNVTVTGADAGTVVGSTVSLTITVTGGGGGGGRK